MLKKTLIATATAATIAGTALALSATGASAAPYYGGYGNGGYGNGYPQHQVCHPITRTVRWFDRWGHPHWVTKVVGQKCTPAPLPPYHPPFVYPHHPWGGGW